MTDMGFHQDPPVPEYENGGIPGVANGPVRMHFHGPDMIDFGPVIAEAVVADEDVQRIRDAVADLPDGQIIVNFDPDPHPYPPEIPDVEPAEVIEPDAEMASEPLRLSEWVTCPLCGEEAELYLHDRTLMGHVVIRERSNRRSAPACEAGGLTMTEANDIMADRMAQDRPGFYSRPHP